MNQTIQLVLEKRKVRNFFRQSNSLVLDTSIDNSANHEIESFFSNYDMKSSLNRGRNSRKPSFGKRPGDLKNNITVDDQLAKNSESATFELKSASVNQQSPSPIGLFQLLDK